MSDQIKQQAILALDIVASSDKDAPENGAVKEAIMALDIAFPTETYDLAYRAWLSSYRGQCNSYRTAGDTYEEGRRLVYANAAQLLRDGLVS